MFEHVTAIAINTYREAIRQRVLYVLIVAGIVTTATATFLAPLALGETVRITKDVGLTTIDLLGLLVVTFLGTSIVYREIEKRTIIVLLSKPIRRYEFLVGKFLGLSMTLALVVAVQTVFLEGAVLLAGGSFDPRVLVGAGMGFLTLVTVNAVAILYSSFAGPLVSAFLTLATFIAGQLAGQLADFAAMRGSKALEYVFYVLPNLASLDVRPEIVHGLAFDPTRLGLAIGHAVSYSCAALLVAVLAFRGREFR